MAVPPPCKGMSKALIECRRISAGNSEKPPYSSHSLLCHYLAETGMKQDLRVLLV